MKGAEIVATLLRQSEPLVDLVPFEFIQMGAFGDDTPMDAILVRSVSLIDTHFLRAEAMQHSTERVAVAVRASEYLGQIAMLERVRAALRGFTGDILGAQRIAIHTIGLGPDLRGPGGSFERTQDLRVSFDTPA